MESSGAEAEPGGRDNDRDRVYVEPRRPRHDRGRRPPTPALTGLAFVLPLQVLMEYLDWNGPSDARVRASRFTRPSGATEVHLCVLPGREASLEEQAKSLRDLYRVALADLDLDPDSATFLRLFLDEVPKPAPKPSVLKAQLFRDARAAVSMVVQPPLPARKLALWAYHVSVPGAAPGVSAVPLGASLRRGSLTHLWLSGFSAPESKGDEARGAFDGLVAALRAHNATLRDHAIRTWIYVPDIDSHYGAMVKARCEVFREQGLSNETHFIASTGIEGIGCDARGGVSLDAYAIAGIEGPQVRYLEAPAHLGPSSAYGVTFERGTSIQYGDRRHTFISGTASIDPSGRTVHVGDVKRQTERTIATVSALLENAGASWSDVAQMLVYVRNPEDGAFVEEYLRCTLGPVPILLFWAPVCRPSWLVEVECIAVSPHVDSRWSPF